MGKDTPSHFDLSNGLPECMRSSQQQPFKKPEPHADQSSFSKTSFNDFNLALLNNRESVPQRDEDNCDHRAFLHDFISEPIGEELAIPDQKSD